jgi:hypothetical protein
VVGSIVHLLSGMLYEQGFQCLSSGSTNRLPVMHWFIVHCSCPAVMPSKPGSRFCVATILTYLTLLPLCTATAALGSVPDIASHSQHLTTAGLATAARVQNDGSGFIRECSREEFAAPYSDTWDKCSECMNGSKCPPGCCVYRDDTNVTSNLHQGFLCKDDSCKSDVISWRPVPCICAIAQTVVCAKQVRTQLVETSDRRTQANIFLVPFPCAVGLDLVAVAKAVSRRTHISSSIQVGLERANALLDLSFPYSVLTRLPANSWRPAIWSDCRA